MLRRLNRYHFLLAGLALVLFSPLLTYTGWCWGLFGRGNLVFRYLFQCSCPAASEEARYPREVDVLISACQDLLIELSPSGRYLDVEITRPDPRRFLLDFVTGDVQDPPTHHAYTFITDDLLLVSPRRSDPYLLTRSTGQEMPIIDLWPHRIPGGELEDDTADPTVLLPLLRGAAHVYLLGGGLVILDGKLMPGAIAQNYLMDESRWLGMTRDGDLLRAFLDEHQIPYEERYWRRWPEWPSHTGAFVARQDGIYLVSTEERIVEIKPPLRGSYLAMSGWVFDDRGLVFRPSGAYVFRETIFSIGISIGHVQQPVLLLKVPPEYLP